MDIVRVCVMLCCCELCLANCFKGSKSMSGEFIAELIKQSRKTQDSDGNLSRTALNVSAKIMRT